MLFSFFESLIKFAVMLMTQYRTSLSVTLIYDCSLNFCHMSGRLSDSSRILRDYCPVPSVDGRRIKRFRGQWLGAVPVSM